MSNKLQSLIQQGESLRSQNKLLEALEIYKKICKLDKNNINTWMIYGSIAGTVSKLDIAESAFRQACKINSRFGKQHEYLIQVLELRGKYETAINTLLQIAGSNQAPADIDLRIGVIYGKAKDFNKSISWLKKYIASNETNAFAHHCIASAYESLDQFENADKHFSAALTINPDDHVILNNYAAMLQKNGKTDQALNTYKKSIKINNQYPISQYNLADLLLLQGNAEEALTLFTRAVHLKKDYIEAIVGQGRCYQANSLYLYALEAYRNAIKINPSHQDTYIHMANTEIALANFDAAEKALQTAIDLDPTNVIVHCTLAELYEKKGDYKASEKVLRPLLKTNPDHNHVALAYGSLCKKLNECDAAIKMINNATRNHLLTPLAKASLHFKAGKILDSMKSYDDAFSHYKKANELQSFTYDAQATKQTYENITSLFSREAIVSLPKSTIENHNPIFVVGMPRSGTTLVEQIISSHPDVFGAGELPYLTTLSRNIAGDFLSGKSIADDFTNLDQAHLNTLSEQYILSTMKHVTGETRFTDKMPHNFALIGVINILFPEAKIINCRRNPIDNCLSIFFSEFNSRHAYANDLSYLADYYNNYYNRLMEHWSTASMLPIYNINYEDVVENQESESRKLIEFCGLEWDDRCLDFHKTKRDVATISYDQVRQPIYRGSVERWRNYEKHISPLLENFQKYV